MPYTMPTPYVFAGIPPRKRAEGYKINLLLSLRPQCTVNVQKWSFSLVFFCLQFVGIRCLLGC